MNQSNLMEFEKEVGMIKVTVLGYEWFAWRPVRLGLFSKGRWIWLRKVIRINLGGGQRYYVEP